MIKLNRSLPNTVTVDGREFFIKTDFRYWLLFDEIIKKKNFYLSDLEFLFVDDIPDSNFIGALVDFYKNPNSTPRGKGSGEEVLDYQQDGEFIYASFMFAYGIDLLDPDLSLHWHQFKALVIGLPSNAFMSEVITMRSYNPDNRKMDTIAKERKRRWSLPKEIDKEILEEIDQDFYNA